jgi:hypothetical protein
MQLDPSFLQSEGLRPPRPNRARRVLLWCVLLVAVAGTACFLLLHVVPTAGAAGGCGGG